MCYDGLRRGAHPKNVCMTEAECCPQSKVLSVPDPAPQESFLRGCNQRRGKGKGSCSRKERASEIKFKRMFCRVKKDRVNKTLNELTGTALEIMPLKQTNFNRPKKKKEKKNETNLKQ